MEDRVQVQSPPRRTGSEVQAMKDDVEMCIAASRARIPSGRSIEVSIRQRGIHFTAVILIIAGGRELRWLDCNDVAQVRRIAPDDDEHDTLLAPLARRGWSP